MGREDQGEWLMSDEDETVELDGEIQEDRDVSWRFYDGKVTTFLPKQLCTWDPDTKKMTVPVWLAEQRGLV